MILRFLLLLSLVVTLLPCSVEAGTGNAEPGSAGTGSAESGTNFSVHKLGTGEPNVLIIGGIQGDEPGGFSAASLLSTSYRITSGAVWVVPNLNFPSIIKRSRGLHGDMNRKFAALPESDPEYSTVRRIQDLIRTPSLRLVLNLHDGGGFYRPTHDSQDRNPRRWGQCLIIDMAEMPTHPQGQLEARALAALADANSNLLAPEHSLHLKNTLTHLGNPEMEKSLSWYAVRNGIPAFGLEASKNFPVDIRAYYHLLMVEALLRQAGVGFERDFPLSPAGIAAALQSNVQIAFAENRVLLPLDNARPRLGGSIPLPRNAMNNIRTSKPILAVTSLKDEMQVHYGNRTVTRFKADWCETDSDLSALAVTIDGHTQNVHFGDLVDVKEGFAVAAVKGYRVNAIGTNFGPDESDKTLVRKHFQERYSLDNASRIYRVEAYKGKRFAGMFLVRFSGATKPNRNTLPAIAGRETKKGM
ncbi:MAG: M99 family carboxypeptidase catalytic domain-containing protein [Bilophila sp.]